MLMRIISQKPPINSWSIPLGEKRKKFIGFDKYNGEDEKTFH